jgi:hypothetical protein
MHYAYLNQSNTSQTSFPFPGITDYLYIPTNYPVAQSDWPTLGQLIDSGRRVLFFMDYGAESGGVDYILPEFEVVDIFFFSPRLTHIYCF